MAKAKKQQVKKYRVTTPFRGHINDTLYEYKKGDVVEWNQGEYDWFSRFVEEITQ